MRKSVVCLAAVASLLCAKASACDHPIVISNWKSCSVGPLSEDAENDWPAVPAWTKSPKITPYFDNEPRMLALHGLCNEKFQRVILCLPGWQEDDDKDTCEYLICSGFEAQH
jgi:hypothetical protein